MGDSITIGSEIWKLTGSAASRYHIGRHAQNLQVANTYEGTHDIHGEPELLIEAIAAPDLLLPPQLLSLARRSPESQPLHDCEDLSLGGRHAQVCSSLASS